MAALAFLFVLLALMPAAAAEPSSGCRAGQGPAPELLAVNGALRHAIVALPDGYRHAEPHVLVFAFHGRTNGSARARRYFGLEDASLKPAIHVYPSGVADESGHFSWWQPGDAPTALRDLAFFDAALAAMAEAFCIDLDAVFVVGHSLGASFANSLACMRGDRIRGVASVAGGINPGPCRGRAAAMLLHHPDDRLVPIDEGRRALEVLLGPDAGGTGKRRTIGGFACERFRDDREPVLWCRHGRSVTARGRYHPHQWPAGTARAIAIFIAELTESN